jgi:hypothetical protein
MMTKSERAFNAKATPAQRDLAWRSLSPSLYAWIKSPPAEFETNEAWGRFIEFPAMVVKVEQSGRTEYCAIDIAMLAVVFEQGGLESVADFVRGEVLATREFLAMAA